MATVEPAGEQQPAVEEGADPGLGAPAELSVRLARDRYLCGDFREALAVCEAIYEADARRRDNLLLLGAVHFQLRNFSESIFFNQQAIRVDANFAEAYGNLGNGLRELGDTKAAIEFYLKAIKLKPRYSDAYNNLASAYMQQGRVKQALETYQMALVLDPSLVNAHSNIGNLYKAQGKLEAARKAYLQAIKIRPDFAIAWSNIAGLYKDEGELETAIEYYKEAVRLAPNLADAHSNMGNALREAGRLDEAEAAFRTAIELRPDFAIAHSNLGNVLYDQGHLGPALSAFRHALLLEPNFPDAHNNLGSALVDTGEPDEALLHFRKCIKLKPDHPHAYNNMGNLLKDRGMSKEAMHCFMTACRLMPRFAAAHSNLGSILKEQGKPEQAIAHYQECVAIDPNFAAAYSNLGNAYKDLGRPTEAIKCFTTALRLDPELAPAYHNLGCAYRDAGRFDDAISCFRKALKLKSAFADAKASLVHTLAMICDWQTREKDMNSLNALLDQQLGVVAQSAGAGADIAVLPPLSVQPFHTFAFSLAELQGKRETLLQLSAVCARRAARIVELQELPQFSYRARLPDERLRVGYVTSNLSNHPASFLLQGAFTGHDTAEFEVFFFATGGDTSSRVWRRVQREVEHFRDMSGCTAFEVAKQINADSVHTLIYLDGYGTGARLEVLAMRPAPLQVALLNSFCAPLCADYVQYTVLDHELAKAVDTRASNEHKLMILPRSFAVADHRASAAHVRDAAALPARSAFGLEEDCFVFACFNKGFKLDPTTFACWTRILERAPNSVLWLLSSSTLAQANLLAEVRARGIREERIIFSDLQPRHDHMARVGLADLVLDTPTCNAQANGLDVLWAGVPIVTCVPAQGGRMASRVSASLLREVGLSDLITHDLEAYEDLAVALATDPSRVTEMRTRLVALRDTSPLFDVPCWVGGVEEGLRRAWLLHETGSPPEDLIL